MVVLQAETLHHVQIVRYVTRLQAHVRGRLVARRYLLVVRWRHAFTALFKANEFVVFSSLVSVCSCAVKPRLSSTKKGNDSAPRHTLILTSQGRVIVFDAISREATVVIETWQCSRHRVKRKDCSLELIDRATGQLRTTASSAAQASARTETGSPAKAVVASGGRHNAAKCLLAFVDRLHDPLDWVRVLSQTPGHPTICELVSRPSEATCFVRAPVTIQGVLTKRAIVRARNWRRRHFVLLGATLNWFHGSVHKGKVELRTASAITKLKDRNTNTTRSR
jgi:hypothetical protein